MLLTRCWHLFHSTLKWGDSSFILDFNNSTKDYCQEALLFHALSIIKTLVTLQICLTKLERVFYAVQPNTTHTHLKKAKLHLETSFLLQCTHIFVLKYWLSKKVDILVYLWRRWSSPSHVLTLYRFHKFPNLYCWLEHFIMLISSL